MSAGTRARGAPEPALLAAGLCYAMLCRAMPCHAKAARSAGSTISSCLAPLLSRAAVVDESSSKASGSFGKFKQNWLNARNRGGETIKSSESPGALQDTAMPWWWLHHPAKHCEGLRGCPAALQPLAGTGNGTAGTERGTALPTAQAGCTPGCRTTPRAQLQTPAMALLPPPHATAARI